MNSTSESYMAAPIEEVNDAITFEQNAFSEIHESKTFCWNHAWTVLDNVSSLQHNFRYSPSCFQSFKWIGITIEQLEW